jgi:hypothetical protein
MFIRRTCLQQQNVFLPHPPQRIIWIHLQRLSTNTRQTSTTTVTPSVARHDEGYNRIGGMPEFIEKWGRGPFYKTSASMILFSVGSGFVFDSPLLSAVLGLPTSIFTVIGLMDISQKEHTLLRNFPVIGHVRYIFESVRPEIRQYFVESDQEAAPFSREDRSLVYQRAKGDADTIPFGTRKDVYSPNFEWMNHSMYPKGHIATPRVEIGSTPNVKYSASLFNISAMSFGAISANAVLALNEAARRGKFYHNTGEGKSAQRWHIVALQGSVMSH